MARYRHSALGGREEIGDRSVQCARVSGTSRLASNSKGVNAGERVIGSLPVMLPPDRGEGCEGCLSWLHSTHRGPAWTCAFLDIAVAAPVRQRSFAHTEVSRDLSDWRANLAVLGDRDNGFAVTVLGSSACARSTLAATPLMTERGPAEVVDSQRRAGCLSTAR